MVLGITALLTASCFTDLDSLLATPDKSIIETAIRYRIELIPETI
jgi:hypothetical protein